MKNKLPNILERTEVLLLTYGTTKKSSLKKKARRERPGKIELPLSYWTLSGSPRQRQR